MPKVTPAHEQRRREQILQAAMACFARNGYRVTSMEEIVRECGLSVGALYTYFPSKEDLFLALADARLEQTLSTMRALFQSERTWAEKCEEAVEHFFRQLDDDFIPLARLNLEFWAEAPKSERLAERQAARYQSLREFFHWLMTAAQQSGDLRADIDVAAAAELLIALHDGLLMHHVNGIQPIPRAALKVAYASFVNYGLAAPSRPFVVTPGSPEAAEALPPLRSGSLVP